MNENELKSTTLNNELNSAYINPKCSCSECDSVECFVARDIQVPCSCVKCYNPKTCFYYSNKVNEKNSELNIAWNTNSFVKPKKKTQNEYYEKEVTYELNNNTKSVPVSKKQSKNCETATGCKSDYRYESERHERPYTNVNNASIKFSRTNLNPATADLSDQVMNVSYKDFKKSISFNKSTNYKRNMTKCDILTRIKEAYKACSCKVCECIAGKSYNTNEFCKSKPCNCNDCSSLSAKFHSLNDSVHFLPVDGCPCIRCTRPQCKAIVNKFNEPEVCDCEPCDCIKYADSRDKPCNCEPCQCVECNAMSTHLSTTFIIASVKEDYQHNSCQCAPCDCIECAHNCAMSSNLIPEMSTRIPISPFYHCETCVNEVCGLEGSNSYKSQKRNIVMMKPIEKDVYGYDNETVLTKKYLERRNISTKNDSDTIAMIATLSGQYLTKYENVKKCPKCNDLVCNYNENTVNSIKSSQLLKSSILSYLKCEDCKFSPYKCQVYIDSNINKENSCKFNARARLNCASITKTFMRTKYSSVELTDTLSSKGIANNKSSPCILCKQLMYPPGDALSTLNDYEEHVSYYSENIYPIKRAKILTPSVLNGIEYQNTESHNETNSLNLDNLMYMSELTLGKKCTNIQNESQSKINIKQMSRDSIVGSDLSSESCITDTNKLNIQTNVDTDILNTELTKNEGSCSEFYNNIFNNTQTVLYDNTNIEDNIQCNDIFHSDSNTNDSSYNYNITNLNKSNTHYNEYINLIASLNEDKNKRADIMDNNSTSQIIVNNIYLDKYITKRICKLSEPNDNTVKNNGFNLSDPQFNLDRNQHEEAIRTVNNAFKIKAHSVIDEGQLVNTYFKINPSFQNVRANYERAQKILHDAKIYSLNLLNILDKYEKANMEFQSVTQKLKDSHNRLIGDSFEVALVPVTDNKIILSNEFQYGAKKQKLRIIDEPKNFNFKNVTNPTNISNTIRNRKLEPVKLKKEDNPKLSTNIKGIPDIKLRKTSHLDLSQNIIKQDICVTQNNNEPNTCNDSSTSECCTNYRNLNYNKKKSKNASYKSNYWKLLRRAIALSKKNRLARKTKTISKECILSEINTKGSTQTVNHLKITEIAEDFNKNSKFNLMHLAPNNEPVSTTCGEIGEKENVKDFKTNRITEQTKIEVYILLL